MDGVLVGKTPLGGPISLAGGKHVIEAQRPGYLPQVRELDVPGTARIAIELGLTPTRATVGAAPALAAAPSAPLVAVAPPPRPGAGDRRDAAAHRWRTSAYILAGIGLTAAVTGGVVAIQSAVAADDARNRAITAADAKPTTQADLNSYDRAKGDFDSARSRSEIGWTVAGVGAVLLAGGVVLGVNSPMHGANVGVSGIAPLLATGGRGLTWVVAW